MKTLFLLFALLITNNYLFSQSMVIHTNDGLKDTIALAKVDSITFLNFQCGASQVSYAGKNYNTVQIGEQCWFKENLDVGTMILVNQDASNNGTIEKYCYSNDPANCSTYGGLYQWNEAIQYAPAITRGICPTGWHMPTKAEFQALGIAASNDGNALIAVGQGTGSGTCTNTSGFSALLAGDRTFDGYFSSNFGIAALFWGTPETNSVSANDMYLYCNPNHNCGIILGMAGKVQGFSVRCVMD